MSENTFILRLFPFLIGDIAHLWQKAILIGSISTWDECKRVFIFKFFFTYRTARIQNDISGFTEKGIESFREA